MIPLPIIQLEKDRGEEMAEVEKVEVEKAEVEKVEEAKVGVMAEVGSEVEAKEVDSEAEEMVEVVTEEVVMAAEAEVADSVVVDLEVGVMEVHQQNQQSQLNSQKKTNQSIAIVTRELNQDLQLDRKLSKQNWKIVIAEKEDNASQVINKTTKSSGNNCTIHLIAHGEPGYLYLGNGISLIELKNIADENLEDKQKLTIWGCEVAKNSSVAIKKSTKMKASRLSPLESIKTLLSVITPSKSKKIASFIIFLI